MSAKALWNPMSAKARWNPMSAKALWNPMTAVRPIRPMHAAYAMHHLAGPSWGRTSVAWSPDLR